ncbi:DUF2809 domain-containing protein [Aeromonas cavernicola]|uniref:DUF2809 domain-containing protein n=1 Tax=Aeromonas cavernicola TaxID=1006623 RepID=A0A2H9U7B0_9GAMM|nr:DUF2809 domain-containing protein [Aeromonas cavernicola]PJG59933.1 DUF2809 domain-containing protein [Aeromonas cavernicola]
MRYRFGLTFIISSLLIVLIGCCAQGWFWRGFLSDVMIVLLLFSLLQMIVMKEAWLMALAVLLFSFVIELAQYYHLVDLLNIENKLLRIAIGNHFDGWDLIAYLVGFMLCIKISYQTQTKPSHLINDNISSDVLLMLFII